MDEQERSGAERPPAPTKRPVPVWLRGRAARWGGGIAAAALLVGGGAVAVAAAGHHGHHGGKVSARDGERGEHDARGGKRHERGGRDWRAGRSGEGRSGGEARPDHRTDRRDRPGPGAPAPLPPLSAADAVAKATAAVPGGRTESLRPATTDGGGRAWQVVVLGPDGVRHLVTVDGVDGTLTGNTVLGG
ncbi:PepSY domain-containing protein [Kitasatospora phosalacinea]|uniref:PepSY domain-containing protein n=1 Tax=Kitasatospora phosalacinea TaxID=2065 RepID=UPI000526986A|nr:PepSY domain-containing protein [Kitasatospora phosalacinea]